MARNITIGIIPPYEAMAQLIEDLKDAFPTVELLIEAGNLEAGVLAAERMEREGADLIISRGGTAQMIRNAIDLPVIEIRISGYDLLRAITLMGAPRQANSALAGFPSVTMGAGSIAGLLDMDIKVATIQKAEEIGQVLEELKKEGISRVLGDVVTVEAAERLGMEGLLIQSGRESVMEAIEEARRLISTMEKSRRKQRILSTVLARQKIDFITLGEDGRTVEAQWTLFDGQPISNEELETMRIKLLSSEIPVLSTAHNGKVRFTVRAERIADRDGTLIYFFFERLDAQEAEALQLEQINHLPLLAADSAAMKNLLLAAEAPACASSLLLLVGKDGLAKQELARYLHVFHGKTGFFAEASAQNLHDIEISSLPDSISTLFIELTAIPDEKKTAYLTVIAQLAAAKNIQLIISIPALTTELAEHTGFEQAILLSVPTLVNRQADIPALVQTYLEGFHQTLGTQPVKVENAALETIVHSVKDSNSASLKAYVKNLALIEKTYVIGSPTLQKTAFMPIGDSAHGMISIDDNETLKEIEQKIINHVLKEEKLNQTKAAHRLGINRATLWRKLKS